MPMPLQETGRVRTTRRRPRRTRRCRLDRYAVFLSCNRRGGRGGHRRVSPRFAAYPFSAVLGVPFVFEQYDLGPLRGSKRLASEILFTMGKSC